MKNFICKTQDEYSGPKKPVVSISDPWLSSVKGGFLWLFTYFTVHVTLTITSDQNERLSHYVLNFDGKDQIIRDVRDINIEKYVGENKTGKFDIKIYAVDTDGNHSDTVTKTVKY